MKIIEDDFWLLGYIERASTQPEEIQYHNNLVILKDVSTNQINIGDKYL